jgi:ribonuclease HII
VQGEARDRRPPGHAPSIERERVLWDAGLHRVVGLDEVGRGSLAGPIVAAACVLPPERIPPFTVRDSKLLSRAQRQRLARAIGEYAHVVTLGAASHWEVDTLNPLRASALAMLRALRRVPQWDYVLYDGLPLSELALPRCTAVVDGDEHCVSIACAAIVAKVIRDQLMERLARRFPAYRWDRNAGYGTAEHLEALQRHGPSPYHRRTFASVRLSLNQLWQPVTQQTRDTRT